MRTAGEAAVADDEYVLTHRCRFERTQGNWGSQEIPLGYRQNRFYAGDSCGSSRVCHFCFEAGHWKNECPVRRARGELSSAP